MLLCGKHHPKPCLHHYIIHCVVRLGSRHLECHGYHQIINPTSTTSLHIFLHHHPLRNMQSWCQNVITLIPQCTDLFGRSMARVHSSRGFDGGWLALVGLHNEGGGSIVVKAWRLVCDVFACM